MAARHGGYLLLPRARADLAAIWTYTAEKWSPAQAESYAADIIAAIEALARGERAGGHAGIGGGYLRLSVGTHVVFYRIGDGRLFVVRILHQRMDFDRHL